ncbi:MAG: polysaccharide deacetylase family protein [Ignavibacteriales bacterium]
MLNALTFDIEEWYHGNLFRFAEPQMARFPSRVAPPTMDILDMLRASGTRATFFFLGVVARDHPELVRRAASEGHEVACHGWEHRLLYTLSDDEVKQDLLRAKGLLEDISGTRVRGFRAPSWSISRRTTHLLRVLCECGFEYDSSAFPRGTPLFGVDGVSPGPTRISVGDGPGRWSIIESPAAAYDTGIGLGIPFGGGLFLRIWPYLLTRSWIRRLNGRGEPAVIYVHPWELDMGLPVCSPVWRRMARDFNLRSTRPKLEAILRDFSLGTVLEMLRERGLYE